MDGKFSVDYTSYLAGINLGSVSYAKTFSRRFGTLHANIKYLNYGTLIGADEQGNETGNFGANDIALSVGYARNLPWTNFSYRHFEWHGSDGADDQKGDEISLEAKLPAGLNIEVGKRSNDGNTKDNEFLKLTWTCCNKDQEEIGISDKAYNLTSVADQKFAKVRRQNLIVKQKEMDLTVIGF